VELPLVEATLKVNRSQPYRDVEYAGSVEECLKNSECTIIVTEWDEFRKLRPEDFIRLMRNPAVVDGRRIYDPKVYSRMLKFKAIGLNYL
jgi:UDPglucose 6-dehydrogenase